MAKAAKKAPAHVDAAEAAVHESLRRAQQVWSSGIGSTVAILKEADANLSAKLHGIVQKHGGPTGKFTEASAMVYRKQIGLVTEYLEKRLAGHTHAQALKAIKVSVADTVTLAKAFEHKFTGITRPLALESQHMQDAVVRGAGASLLQKHQTSWKRYGKAMVGDMERVLRTASLEGLTHEQTVSRLVEAGKLGGHTAGSLHGNEPQHFPEPTSYVKRRYWAERIVRTENAHALSAGALQGMNILREKEFPDLQKKILATFDNRTAPDSVAVHGQVRKLEEYFMDGAGRTYLHPPGRPNDRETIIPWRPHWEPTPSTQAPPAEVVAEAQVAAQPSPVGEKRKGDLKAALQQAKAKVLGQKKLAQKATEEAQAYSLAQLKAQAAQAEGQQALGHAVLADEAQLKAAAEKLKHATVPGAKFNAAKAKAQEYLQQQKAIAEAKVAAQLAERQAKLEAAAKSVLEVYQKPGTFESGAEVLAALKGVAKTDARMLGEIWHQATGKPAEQLRGLKPMQLGKAIKQLAKKIQPDLKYPEPKKKLPKLSPEQALAQKKAALLAHNADLVKAAAEFTEAEVHALVAGNPLVLPGEVTEVLAMSPQGKGAYLHQVVKDWEELKFEAAKAEIQIQKSGGKIYLDVYQAGSKNAYYFQEGTEAAPEYVVKPPASIAATHPEKKFTVQVEATAYALEVGNKLTEEKAFAAKEAAQAAKALAAEKKLAPVIKKAAPASSGAKPWSEKWETPERPVADLKTSPAHEVAEHLKPNRAGVGVLMDEDYIENFGVSFTQEKVGARQEVVVRFKVTEHRGDEVRKRLEVAGARPTDYGYKRKASLETQPLEYASTTIERRPDGAKAITAQKNGVHVTMLKSQDIGGAELAAAHNVVEMRFAMPANDGDIFAKAKEGFETLGIGTAKPKGQSLEAYRRAKIMAYADPDSARELRALKDRSPAAVQQVWEKSVKRNPHLAAIEAGAELREIAPGQHALYSPELSKQLEEAGVRWLSHTTDKGADIVQLMLQRPEDGLLSSRERYQRGLFFEGQSTDRDFVTGGADSGFLRLVTSDPADVGGLYARWTFQVDPSEAGRLDAYFTNEDNFGKATAHHKRETVSEMAALAREGRLQGDNELMLQKQVPRSSFRRLVAREASDRKQLIELLSKQGVNEINGVPLEEFVVLRPR